MSRWTLAAVTSAALFFVLAVSNSVYEATSPGWLSWHVALRKCYSVVAFAIVGYTFLRALAGGSPERTPRALVVCAYVAAYSAAIEVAQCLHGAREGLGWNAFDVACGATGGALAALAEGLRLRSAGASGKPR